MELRGQGEKKENEDTEMRGKRGEHDIQPSKQGQGKNRGK